MKFNQALIILLTLATCLFWAIAFNWLATIERRAFTMEERTLNMEETQLRLFWGVSKILRNDALISESLNDFLGPFGFHIQVGPPPEQPKPDGYRPAPDEQEIVT